LDVESPPVVDPVAEYGVFDFVGHSAFVCAYDDAPTFGVELAATSAAGEVAGPDLAVVD
jgi:hypothetical protein